MQALRGYLRLLESAAASVALLADKIRHAEPIEVELKDFVAPMRVQTVRWAEATG